MTDQQDVDDIESTAIDTAARGCVHRGISGDATKAIVRQKLGLRSLNRNLIIEGVAPGSVHVILRADAPIETSDTQSIPDVDASSPDSVALRTVARVFTIASSEEPSVSADFV